MKALSKRTGEWLAAVGHPRDAKQKRLSSGAFHSQRKPRLERPSLIQTKLSSARGRAFTLIEIMIAIAILSFIIAGIYSAWTAIVRAAGVANRVAASVQRARITVRTI